MICIRDSLVEPCRPESATIRRIHPINELELWFLYFHEHTLSDSFSFFDIYLFFSHIDIGELDRISISTIVLVYNTDTIDLHETIVLECT